MWDGYAEVPVTSRAAEAELERQRARRGRRSLDMGMEAELEPELPGFSRGRPEGRAPVEDSPD